MDPKTIAGTRTAAYALWQKFRGYTSPVPVKAWIIFGLFLVAATLMALHTALAGKDSNLRIKVQHSFRSAQIAVWVDGDLSYSGKLVGTVRKKYGLFSESVQGSLSQTIPISAGKHYVRVQITGEDGSSQQDTISGDFATKSERTLSVSARHSDVSLSWQGSSIAADSSGGSGWVARYANTLFLTIAGSIISALAGFAVKEVPGYVKSRQNSAPKAESAGAGH